MKLQAINATFARNVAEAYAVLSYMRTVADSGKDQIMRSQEKLESSRVLLKSTPR